MRIRECLTLPFPTWGLVPPPLQLYRWGVGTPSFLAFPTEKHEWAQDLTQRWLLRLDLSDNLDPQGPQTMIMANDYEIMELIGKLPLGVDMSRARTVAIRPKFYMDENFDLITQWNINDEVHRRLVLQFFSQCEPVDAITAPTYCLLYTSPSPRD